MRCLPFATSTAQTGPLVWSEGDAPEVEAMSPAEGWVSGVTAAGQEALGVSAIVQRQGQLLACHTHQRPPMAGYGVCTWRLSLVQGRRARHEPLAADCCCLLRDICSALSLRSGLPGNRRADVAGCSAKEAGDALSNASVSVAVAESLHSA